MTSPLSKYQQIIQSGKFQPDAQQGLAIREFERIHRELSLRLKKKIFSTDYRRYHQPIKGLYLWGNVGIGKTWLMDLFCDVLPNGVAVRMHFHQFMQLIHKQLRQLQGEKNPLALIAKDFAKKHRILCFDEFFVTDITDAMLLTGLLKALFSYGITLVTTSNVEPNLLYKGGINRERFLPAIELLQSYTQVLHLSTHKDYRLQKLTPVCRYYFPITPLTSHDFNQHFKMATDNRYCEDEILTIEEREIITVAAGRGVVWFDFKVLCTIPRNQVDYLEVAKLFETVFLSNVPQFSDARGNEILYFINLIDVLYDAKTKLIILADVAIDELNSSQTYKFEFRRTRSRLHEMQSKEYS